ncbi:S-Ena type endospore appendage [Neobacillus niacini]|uniref:S-Ena type endospore appendage n=1 Tax=Neobacillus niacini TaxID=86668 RepID=UPI002FFFA246
MCGSQGSNSNCCCCPNAIVLQEKICGNLAGPLPVPVPSPGLTLPFLAWEAPDVNDYFQGTFEIFNAGPATITAEVLDSTGGVIATLTVPPGNSVSVSVNNPDSFSVTVPDGTHGKFCITLYKRLFG